MRQQVKLPDASKNDYECPICKTAHTPMEDGCCIICSHGTVKCGRSQAKEPPEASAGNTLRAAVYPTSFSEDTLNEISSMISLS